MRLPRNQKLTKAAQFLRHNMTKEERHLWYDFLKNYTVQFHRQRVVGNFIVDFYCHRAKLIVELDGSQHFQNTGLENDLSRTNYLNSLGLFVLRVPNNEIWDSFEAVCESIDNLVQDRLAPHISQPGADSFSLEKPEISLP